MQNRHKLYICWFIVVGFVLFVTSCKSTAIKKPDQKSYIVYPEPPDTARFQFLTSLSSSSDLVAKKRKSFTDYVTGVQEENKTINKPFGITMKYGKIYVADLGKANITIVDLEKRVFRILQPSGKNKFIIPVNVFVDYKGYLYVADSGRKEVLVFDNELNLIRTIKKDDVFQPLDVYATKERIYVANLKSQTIDVFSNDSVGSFLFSFPNLEQGDDGYLNQPKNITIGNNKIYVSDFGGFNVEIFNLEGEYLSTLGSQGMSIGQFARPKGIAVDKDENVFVLDASFGIAQVFNKDNQVLMYFGGQSENKTGNMYLPAQVWIDYDNLNYFKDFVDPKYNLKYIVLVTSQYGKNKINVYGRIELK